MPTWLIIVIVVLLVLAIGGYFARKAQLERSRPAFERSLEQVNRDLAAAAAADRGWDRDTLEQAARRIYAEQRGGAEPPSSRSSRSSTAPAPTRTRRSSVVATSA